MPTYEYLCKHCGERFEVVQPFRAKPLRRHDRCGGEVQKVFHARGVVFKGSGFYVTDSRSKAKSASGNGSSAKSSEPASSEAPAATGTEG